MLQGTKRYSNSEIQFILNNYQTMSVREIASTLNRTEKGVRHKIEQLNLNLSDLPRNAAFQFNDEQITFIKENYLKLSDERMSKILNISERLICLKRISLGLRIHHCNEYIENGYAKRYIDGKKVWVHRHNAELKYSRKLDKSEKVHHINGDKLDNRPENLYVCSDRSFHDIVHHSLRRVAFELVKQGVIKFDENSGKYYL